MVTVGGEALVRGQGVKVDYCMGCGSSHDLRAGDWHVLSWDAADAQVLASRGRR